VSGGPGEGLLGAEFELLRQLRTLRRAEEVVATAARWAAVEAKEAAPPTQETGRGSRPVAGQRELSPRTHEVCGMLDDMQAQLAALTYLRSMVGLVRLCRQAAATPARLYMLLARARRRYGDCFS
jgi:hypothetical protein